MRAVWRHPLGIAGIVAAVVVVSFSIVVGAGLTDSYGSGTVLETNTGWFGDRSKPADFWDGTVVDFPGASLVGLHCHGKVQYNLQLGATRPTHNPCYAAMGLSSDWGGWGVMYLLPGGRAVYRSNPDDKRYRYCINRLFYEDPPKDVCAP